jgi:hypothetical protein
MGNQNKQPVHLYGNNSIEQIRQELEKIMTLKFYSCHASETSFQVYDKRTNEMVIDADFRWNMIDNIIDGLFKWGSLYKYLLKREQNVKASVATDDASSNSADNQINQTNK